MIDSQVIYIKCICPSADAQLTKMEDTLVPSLWNDDLEGDLTVTVINSTIILDALCNSTVYQSLPLVEGCLQIDPQAAQATATRLTAMLA